MSDKKIASFSFPSTDDIRTCILCREDLFFDWTVGVYRCPVLTSERSVHLAFFPEKQME